MSLQAIVAKFPSPFQEECQLHLDKADSKPEVVLWGQKEIEQKVANIERFSGDMEARASWTDTLWKVITVISLALLAVTVALGFALGMPLGPLFLIFAIVPATTGAMSMWHWIAAQSGDLQGKELAQQIAQQLLHPNVLLNEWESATTAS